MRRVIRASLSLLLVAAFSAQGQLQKPASALAGLYDNKEQHSIQEYALQLLAGQPVKIGLYGSSTYAGVWTSNGASGSTNKGPGYWMQYFLNAYFFNSAAAVDSSASAGGTTTDDFLGKWEDMMATTPNQIVIVGWGSNDVNTMPARRYRQNLIYMALVARKAGKTVVFDTPHQTTVFAGSNRAETLKQFAEVMRQVSRELAVPLVDSNLWSDQLFRTGLDLNEWISDGVHFSPDGLRLKGALLASLMLGHTGRVSGETTISTDLPDWRVYTDVNAHAIRPATRYGRATGGKNFRLAFYVDRPGLDLYVAIPNFSGGGPIGVKIDGVKNGSLALSSLNRGMDLNTGMSVDVDTMIAENLLPGFHVVELDSSAVSLIYYARFAQSRSPRSGTARSLVLSNFAIPAPAAAEDVLLTEIPTSNSLHDVDLRLTANFGLNEGIVLFASRYGTTSSISSPRGGLYVYRASNGRLSVREWQGAAGYTRPVELDGQELTPASHSYRVTVTPSGVATVYVDGIRKGAYTMTVHRTGGFLGFYKNNTDATTIETASLN